MPVPSQHHQQRARSSQEQPDALLVRYMAQRQAFRGDLQNARGMNPVTPNSGVIAPNVGAAGHVDMTTPKSLGDLSVTPLSTSMCGLISPTRTSSELPLDQFLRQVGRQKTVRWYARLQRLRLTSAQQIPPSGMLLSLVGAGPGDRRCRLKRSECSWKPALRRGSISRSSTSLGSCRRTLPFIYCSPWPPGSSDISDLAATLLIEVEPTCPLTCEDALRMLGCWQVSDHLVPFYLKLMFGKARLLEALASMVGEMDRPGHQPMGTVAYWVRFPSVETIDGNMLDRDRRFRALAQE